MDPKRRLIDAIQEAFTACGEIPEGTIRDRILQHLMAARTEVDVLIGSGPENRMKDIPMSSRMS